MRSLRVHGDENVAPTLAANRTIHQRNKSSPALYTMAHTAGLKAVAKRTAFGDVSNIANTLRPSKDDSVLNGKAGSELFDKAILLKEQKKPTALLRPAQRPLNVSGLKGMLSHVTNSNNTVAARQPLVDTQPTTFANTRKVLTKRATTIFKDSAPIPTEQPTNDLLKPLLSTSSVAPVHRDLIPPQQEIQLDVSTKPQSALPAIQTSFDATSYNTNHGPVKISNPTTTADEVAPRRSDGAYIDDNGEVVVCSYTDETDHVEERAAIPVGGSVLPAVENEVLAHIDVNLTRDVLPERQELEIATKHALPPLSEPEEYWDDEEEVETYDEEGYTTARSFKSRGDNTTGGATTVLFPKVNQKVKREIAAAKDLVEGTRTAEDIEDETWDTSMVAEYGEEIFEYMRELEVSASPYFLWQSLINWNRSRCCRTPTTWTTRPKFSGPCAPFLWIG